LIAEIAHNGEIVMEIGTVIDEAVTSVVIIEMISEVTIEKIVVVA
jgi:hypothetical protein